MKYYSELTKKVYDTEEILEAEETKYTKQQEALAIAKKEQEELAQKKANERKERAQEVAEAYDAIREARKNYVDLLNKFCKDYGSYHYTYKLNNSEEGFPFGFSNLFDFFS